MFDLPNSINELNALEKELKEKRRRLKVGKNIDMTVDDCKSLIEFLTNNRDELVKDPNFDNHSRCIEEDVSSAHHKIGSYQGGSDVHGNPFKV